MKDSSRSMDVLKKILSGGAEAPAKKNGEEKLIENFFLPQEPITKKLKGKPGRPPVEESLKARNFTLCLAPKYLTFLDQMKMRDPKIKGRGRKIRFIIDQFVELHRRQKLQLQVLSESLAQVDKVLGGFSSQVKKGQSLSLTTKERAQITHATGQVKILMKVLKYTSKDLNRLLSKSDFSVLSFCLNWSEEK